ncbi:hypothetical protein GM415_05180 [Pseudodesulfovibrio cashew]|uniref:Uncharacterized protein n=1 Tax=Pseudodesulfovibrio cashew TaxID=2678688 RepID=A0A6I6J9Q3_9BACT|nr:hypothetical protein [Pseudodesulfovibrio cashew]QGY39536.1 hypothetical protein GM415_05180 [Pseudodesulfovibrio cashew]
MKYLKITAVLLIVVGIYFFKSDWFQASFFPESYYKNTCFVPFDVTKEGNTITIPLKYTHSTCYSLAISVTDKDIFHDNIVGPGTLKYHFISKGQIIATGNTYMPNRRHLRLINGVTSINILVFNLPYRGAGKDLKLQLTVHEPFNFLSAYKEKTFCEISPDYNPKVGKCYNDTLMISN